MPNREKFAAELSFDTLASGFELGLCDRQPESWGPGLLGSSWSCCCQVGDANLGRGAGSNK